MANEQIVNQNAPVAATTNPINNVQQLESGNTINIPLQITPVVAQPNNAQFQSQQVPQVPQTPQSNVPTPVAAQPQTNNYNNMNFSNYKSQYQYNMPQFSPIQLDTNNVSEYKSQYATVINEMANQILNTRFNYNPNEDDLLKQAARYTTQNTYESMNSKGILNSSLTAERVTKVVGELIPTFEKMAREEFESNFNMLMNTAQFIMNLDESQYTRWENDRQMKWKKEQFEYEKARNAIKDAWERVDELGYVDNAASIALGVKVGTLSKDAREAKEQREYEIEEWNRKQKIQHQAEKELLLLKRDIAEQQANADLQREKELVSYKSQFSSSSGSSSSTKTTSLSTYEGVIKNRFANYNEMDRKYTVPDSLKQNVLAYLREENEAGRLSDNDALALIAKYDLRTGSNTTKNSNSATNILLDSLNYALKNRR